MIAFAAIVATLAAQSPPVAGAVVEETRCMWLVRSEGGEILSVEAPGLNVLEQSARPDPFAPALPAHAQGLQCGRTTIVPAEHDDEVLDLGVPLYIVEVTETGTGRLGALERSGGRYRYGLLEGNLTEAEGQAVTERLNLFQRRP